MFSVSELPLLYKTVKNCTTNPTKFYEKFLTYLFQIYFRPFNLSFDGVF